MSKQIRLEASPSYDCPGLYGTKASTLVSGDVCVRLIAMPEWTWDKPIPFFPPVHSSVRKLIVPLSGWVACVDSIVPAGYTVRHAGAYELLQLWPPTDYVLLFGPGSVVQVTTIGTDEDDAVLPPDSLYWKVFARFTRGDLHRAYDEKLMAKHRGEYTD